MAEAQWHPKREAKRFEPPPWEREQFDALQRSRDAEVAPEGAGEVPASGETREAEAAEQLAAELAAARERAAQQAEEAGDGPEPGAGDGQARAAGGQVLPDAQVEAMLIQLGAEEPKVDEHLKTVGVFASALAMFFGACMVFWGLYALLTARGQLAGVVGALIVAGFGGLFGGLGLWFGWRVTNRGE